jgi:hypothetical protein
MPRQVIPVELSPPLRRIVTAVSKKITMQFDGGARAMPGDALGRQLTRTGE